MNANISIITYYLASRWLTFKQFHEVNEFIMTIGRQGTE